jgi:hypothetical protein
MVRKSATGSGTAVNLLEENFKMNGNGRRCQFGWENRIAKDGGLTQNQVKRWRCHEAM